MDARKSDFRVNYNTSTRLELASLALRPRRPLGQSWFDSLSQALETRLGPTSREDMLTSFIAWLRKISQNLVVNNAAVISFNNAHEVMHSEFSGCYACGTISHRDDFDGLQRKFLDDGETAICPQCHVDAILPGCRDLDIIDAANKHWCHPEAA